MKRRHPIDEVFHHGLAYRSEETPVHLWEQIDRRRPATHRWRLYLRRRRGALLTATAFLVATFVSAWFLWTPSTLRLGHFPVKLDQPASTVGANIPLPPATLPAARQPIADLPPETPGVAAHTTPPQPTARQLVPAVRALKGKAMTSPFALTPAISSGGPGPMVRKKTPGSLVAPSLPLPTLSPAELNHEPLLPAQLLRDPKCARFHRVYWRLAIDLAVSPDRNFRQLRGRDPDYDSYARVREDSETAALSYSAGLRFSAISNFGLALRGGLNYTQINERFEYLNLSEERITITNVYGPDGQITGTDTIVETGTRHKVTHNRYRLIDIPLIIGYERRFKKVGVSVNAGAYLNLLFRQKGDFLSSQDQQPVSFSSANPNAFPAFRERLGISWYGSLGLTYDLTHDLQLLVEPHFRLNPKSFTQSDYPITQRYFTAGMSVGIRKTL